MGSSCKWFQAVLFKVFLNVTFRYKYLAPIPTPALIYPIIHALPHSTPGIPSGQCNNDLKKSYVAARNPSLLPEPPT
jgi:hypothetical protein